MIKIQCSQCKMMLDSVFELRLHRFETHYDYFLKRADGDAKLLIRNVGMFR